MKTYFLHPESIRSLFDNIAPTYDLLNHLLSLGRDFYWRKKAVHELRGREGWILDIATGTGDVAIEMIYQGDHQRKVSGLDFSEPMIKKAKQKVSQKGLSQAITLSLGDAVSLPFRDNTFSASLIAFGLRNIVQKERALSEMVRVLRPGGYLIYGDFVFPSWAAKIARFIRFVGFPTTRALQVLAEKAGLGLVYESHGFGTLDVIWRKNGGREAGSPP